MTAPSSRDRIAVLEKAFSVLELFGPDTPALRIVDIAARAGMNRSSAQRLVQTLILTGWLARDDASGLLSLTHRSCYPAHVFLQCNTLIELVMPLVVELNARTGASCDLWLVDNDSLVTLARVPSPTAALSLAPVGGRQTLCDAAPGRALLATLPPNTLAAHLAEYAQKHGPAARDALMQRIDRERIQGYAADVRGQDGGIEYVATGFRDALGKTIAVVSLSGMASSVSRETAAAMLVETCRGLDELRILPQPRPANLEPVARVFWPFSDDDSDPLVVTAVTRAFHLIQFFHPLQPVLTLTELSRKTGFPIPTVQRITETLAALGYLEKNALRKTFNLSVRWLDFLYRFQMGSMLIRSMWAKLVRLREESGLRCSFCILDRTEIAHLMLIQSRPHRSFRSVYPGARLPAVSTSGGRAILSCLPRQEMEGILAESTIVAVTPHTVLDKDHIREDILSATESHIAYTDQQTVREEVNIAMAVVGVDGRPLGAIVVSAPIADWSVERLKSEIAPLLRSYNS
ncbi:IclR family transcriptional regulator [Agrobacterium tumefaciens]|uniref:IclR family transcriptional regulator n=1 Tax=Agrobacterium tumefaciens TaxID=358 RepID=UPI00157258E4|nr:helix-turn-helix domain-containing protein [Agrobacterium tumefaciens]